MSTYYGDWDSCDGFYDGEVCTIPPEAPYPAMVRLDLGGISADFFGATMAADDARALGTHLLAAANAADVETRRSRVPEPRSGEERTKRPLP